MWLINDIEIFSDYYRLKKTAINNRNNCLNKYNGLSLLIKYLVFKNGIKKT